MALTILVEQGVRIGGVAAVADCLGDDRGRGDDGGAFVLEAEGGEEEEEGGEEASSGHGTVVSCRVKEGATRKTPRDVKNFSQGFDYCDDYDYESCESQGARPQRERAQRDMTGISISSSFP